MTDLDAIRAAAAHHARQLEAVTWLSVKELAARWGVSESTVRGIEREKLPYITLGGSSVRRFHPDDVERFEAHERKGEEAKAS